jgi:hypothetical protein
LTLFETPLSPVEWAVLLLAGLYFLTRIPWWTRKACVPGPEAVEYVQAHAPEWGKRAAGWIADFPSVVNAFGFFATPLWLLIIALNLVLLAQSLEVFMPSAQRLEIPFFGSYTWLSLLAGLLFSLSQTVFGVIAGENKRRSIVVLCLMMVGVSICVEMGLAGYRSYMIITHVVDVDANTADSLLSKGVALTMFISFIVPIAHTSLGFIAIPRFLVPLANYAPRLVGGILVFLWSWFVRFFFGFQRVVIVPVAISQLRTQTNDLKSRISKTADGCKAQQKNLLDLRDLGAPFSDLQAKAGLIATEANGTRQEWKTKSDELSGQVSALESVAEPVPEHDEQWARVIEEAAGLKAGIERRVRDRIVEAKRLIGLLEALPKVDQNWRTKHADLLGAVPLLTTETAQQRKDLESLRAIHKRYVEILDPPPDAVPQERATGDFRVVELEQLRRRFFEAQRDSERYRINRVLTICTGQLNQFKSDLDAAETHIESNAQSLADIGRRLAEVTPPPPAPPAQAIDAEKRKLEGAMQDMVTASYEVAAGITRFSAGVNRRKKEHQHKKKGGFFAWISRVLAEFVDAIMHAHTEKKQNIPEAGAEIAEEGENPPNRAVKVAAGGENR